ncbi:TRAP transporter substrate-binding protein [Rhodohalobacter sp. 614A]|uniref:TRAP transporter substrate-binding protein n=1 Tax=Rhodohalobacter sp. 614A TaxID=2908649 RepID=UPI001F3D3D40|nr:TRAP transporter substrate-binding protein [Rhodohalobacter sp. 614A]
MKKMRFNLLIFTLLLGGLFISGCEQKTETKVIRLGHGLDITHPVHKAMVFMAEQVDEKSDGSLQIKVYPSQQLGTERELIELLQIGSLGITKVSAAVLENFTPKARVFSLPYLFRDDAHMYNVLDGEIGRELLLEPQHAWLRGLTYYDAGKRSFYTKDRPIETPEDLEGLKIRVLESQMAISMVNELGGSPTPISWGELYSALQQGIVDAAENNPPSFHTSRHYEVCKYYSLDEHTAIPDVLLIGTNVWNDLTENQKKWLQEAADTSAIYQRKLWHEAEETALREVEAAGVEINRPDKEPFRELTEPIYNRIQQESPEIYEVVERIREVES